MAHQHRRIMPVRKVGIGQALIQIVAISLLSSPTSGYSAKTPVQTMHAEDSAVMQQLLSANESIVVVSGHL